MSTTPHTSTSSVPGDSPPTATTAAMAMPVLTRLDPRRLVPNPRNPRTGPAPAIDDLLASIPHVGILQPLVVIPLPDSEAGKLLAPDGAPASHYILIGHRRHLAAIALELSEVLCLVAADEDHGQQLFQMLIENDHRQDLTVAEETAAYQQLALYDYAPEQIAATLAKPVERIRSALTIQALPTPARDLALAAADAGSLDLEQAAQLEQFADDPKAMARLTTKAAGPWGFKHALTEEANRRKARDGADRLRAELTLAGVKVTAKPKDFGYKSREAAADSLRDGHDEPLVAAEMQARPGFAVFIETNTAAGTATPVVYCVDPEAWGYTRSVYSGYLTDQQRQASATAAQEAEAHAAALVTAAEVRREFLTQTYGTAKAAKTHHLQALRAGMGDPRGLCVVEAQHQFLRSLAGIPARYDTIADAAGEAGTDRLTRLLVARWIVGNEHNLESSIARRWGANDRTAIAYLDQLTDAGYALSDAETRAHTDISTRVAAEDAAGGLTTLIVLSS